MNQLIAAKAGEPEARKEEEEKGKAASPEAATEDVRHDHESTRIIMVPRVKVAYTTADFNMILADKAALQEADREALSAVLEQHHRHPQEDPSFDIVAHQRAHDRIAESEWVLEPPKQVEFHDFNRGRGFFKE